MKKILPFFWIFPASFAIQFFHSCQKDKCDVCNEAPVISSQTFNLSENVPVGTVVGTVVASDPDGSQKITFAILDGNTGDAFTIDRYTGTLYVNDSSLINYEKNPQFDLTVEVSDSCKYPLTSANTISIKITDITPTHEGLIAYYDFENSFSDNAGSYNGSGYYTDFVSSVTEQSNHMLYLNGYSSYVDLSNPFDFETRSINLWFNVLNNNGDLGLIYSSDNPALNYGMTLLSVKDVQGNLELYYNVSNRLDTATIEKGIWYNATLIADGLSYEYYLNGRLIGKKDFDGYVSSYNGYENAVLGCLRTLDQRFFQGMVDELRIYSRKLTPDEIMNLYLE